MRITDIANKVIDLAVTALIGSAIAIFSLAVISGMNGNPAGKEYKLTDIPGVTQSLEWVNDTGKRLGTQIASLTGIRKKAPLPQRSWYNPRRITAGRDIQPGQWF